MRFPVTPNKQTLSVPITASATTLGPPFQLAANAEYDQLVIIATLTGMSASTLDLYIQESWDGGTTWYDVAHFGQVAGGAAAVVKRVVLGGTGAIQTVGVGGTPALAVATVCDGPWAPLLRLVSVTGTGTSSAPVNQVVQFIIWQQTK